MKTNALFLALVFALPLVFPNAEEILKLCQMLVNESVVACKYTKSVLCGVLYDDAFTAISFLPDIYLLVRE